MALTEKQKRQLEELKRLEREAAAEEKKQRREISKFLESRYGKGWTLSEIDKLIHIWHTAGQNKLPSVYLKEAADKQNLVPENDVSETDIANQN